jgi:Protein of unknown function (DUF429)
MFFSQITYLGIDPTSRGRPITYAALSGQLELLALAQGDLEQVLSFVAGQQAALVAVCAPRSPNRGLMQREEVRESLSPRPRPGRWLDYRLAEYQLRQRNITTPRTTADESRCPGWMRTGFSVYQRLEQLGYQPYAQDQKGNQSLEAYPHASYTALLERIPLSKHTLEGRLQRQLILHEVGLHIPDPMLVFEEITRYRLIHGILPLETIYSTQELDALVAAFTAWSAGTKPDQVTLLGDAEEGLLVLPVAELKGRYSGSHAQA